MRQETIVIDSSEKNFVEALNTTLQMGEEAGLDSRELIRLRLLTEELIGLLRGIAGEVTADYTVKQYGKEFTLQLKGDVNMDSKMHKQLLDASSSGSNAAVKGFMSKMREMIGTMVLPGTLGHTLVSGFSMGLMTMSGPTPASETGAGVQAYMWSMDKYIDSVKANNDTKEWDELEKSIVANIADEIKVSIVGSLVEITIFKTF